MFWVVIYGVVGLCNNFEILFKLELRSNVLWCNVCLFVNLYVEFEILYVDGVGLGFLVFCVF